MTVQLILLSLENTEVTTQAAILAKQLGVPHISMRQLLSPAMRDRFTPDLQALQQSNLPTPPDTEQLAMLEVRLRQPDARQGWILTGFPTDLAQARSLHLLLEYMGCQHPQVLYLSQPRQVLLERLSLETTNPEQQLEQNRQQLAPIIEYYQERGDLLMVEGHTILQVITERLFEGLQVKMCA